MEGPNLRIVSNRKVSLRASDNDVQVRLSVELNARTLSSDPGYLVYRLATRYKLGWLSMHSPSYTSAISRIALSANCMPGLSSERSYYLPQARLILPLHVLLKDCTQTHASLKPIYCTLSRNKNLILVASIFLSWTRSTDVHICQRFLLGTQVRLPSVVWWHEILNSSSCEQVLCLRKTVRSLYLLNRLQSLWNRFMSCMCFSVLNRKPCTRMRHSESWIIRRIEQNVSWHQW
jgi:hypothetical protein